MARNRQRAKDRKRRAAERPDSAPLADSAPASLEHTGSIDEVDAALAEGAASDSDVTPDPAGVVPVAISESVGPTPTTRADGGPRFWNFLKACWAELQRVQWPDRPQVGQATAVVLGFVVLAGAYLGIADRAAQELVDLIL